MIEINTPKKSVALAVAGLTTLGLAAIAQAQPGTGPVATACKAELAKHCADKPHGQGEARACLIANKDTASDSCREALATTGPGHGMGMRKGSGSPTKQ